MSAILELDKPVGEVTSPANTDKPKFTPVYKLLDKSVKKRWPELKRCNSATQASKVMYGVQGMTRFIYGYADARDAIMAFFGSDTSSMVAWSKHVQVTEPELEVYQYDNGITRNYVSGGYLAFHAKPEHKAGYKLTVKCVGLPLAVRITQAQDCGDTLRGITYLHTDKRRWARFQRDILNELGKWPGEAHVPMIHDYAMRSMQAAERRKQAPVTKDYAAIPVTLPQFEAISTLNGNTALTVGDTTYQVLVPRHEADLRRIGTAQRHCVGTAGMGYADRIRENRIVIVALFEKTLGDGVCVEMSKHSGSVYQAQGRHRRGPSNDEQTIIDRICAVVRKEATDLTSNR